MLRRDQPETVEVRGFRMGERAVCAPDDPRQASGQGRVVNIRSGQATPWRPRAACWASPGNPGREHRQYVVTVKVMAARKPVAPPGRRLLQMIS